MKRMITLAALLVFVRHGKACPFCELGANDTAYFIVGLLVPFIAGMAFLFFAGFKSGMFSKQDGAGQQLIETENKGSG